MKKIIIIFIGVILFNSASFGQGYKIEVKIKGVENQDIILGYHKNDNLVPYDTAHTDNKGYAVFKGKKPLHKGIYFMFLPSKTYFDIIIGGDQTFSIENDTIDLYKNLKTKGSEEVSLFVDYRLYLIDQNVKMMDIRDKYKKETDPDKKKELEKEMKDISTNVEDYFQKIEDNYPNLFFTTFLKATGEISIPDTITDKMAQYQYYKNHYFDDFDVSNTGLLYTPIYEKKIDDYLQLVLAMQSPDSVIVAVDYLLDKAEAAADSNLYQYMLIHLYNKYATDNMMIAENIYVHLGDIYVKKAFWSSDSTKNAIKTKNARKKNCLIGNKALAFSMTMLPSDSTEINNLRPSLETMKEKGLEIEKDDSRTFEDKVPDLSQLIAEYMSFFPSDKQLYNVNSKYTILWFMTPDCSHCRKETPLFYKEYVDKLKNKDVAVWCIYMERNTDNWNKFSNGIGEWFDFVEKNKFYEWNNVWNPFANYRFKYDISSSPVLYLLDKDKKIIAKRLGYEQAIEIILEMEKKEEPK